MRGCRKLNENGSKVTKLTKKLAADVAADKKPSDKHVAVKSESALHPAGRMYIIDRSIGHAYIELLDATGGRRKRWLTVAKVDATKLGISPVVITSSLFDAIVVNELTKEESTKLKEKVYKLIMEQGCDNEKHCPPPQEMRRWAMLLIESSIVG